MTTIFGLRHPKIEAAVLVADRQVTQSDRNSGALLGKHLARKLWVGKEDLYCFGQAGDMNQDSQEFMRNLAEGKYDIEKITKKGYFPELRKLNVKRMGRQVPDNSKLSSFLLATRFDNKPKLYTCFPLGEVGERIWTTIGSGDQIVTKYMDSLQTLNIAKNYQKESSVDVRGVIQVGLEAVRLAQGHDLYSHGLDMLVCTPEGINDHFTELGDDFGKKLKGIQRKYSGVKTCN